MATKFGLIKRTALSEFESIRKVGKIAIALNEGDELIGVQIINDDDEVLLAGSSGKCIRFAVSGVRPTGRTSMGVRSLHLDGDDKVVDMAVIRANSEMEVLTISEQGYGKRSDVSEYHLQSRGGKGTLAGKFDEKTGKLVNLKLIMPTDDIMIIADNGIIIRIKAEEVSKISRNTKGVRIMKVKDDGNVVCVAVAPAEIDEEETEQPSNAQEQVTQTETSSQPAEQIEQSQQLEQIASETESE
jgi:DNA gyrase subunit A